MANKPRFDHQFTAHPLQVRDALTQMRRAPVLSGASGAVSEICELVLAEAMNNIVEHAYAGQGGPLRLTMARTPSRVICRLQDRGRPMPGLVLPAGELAASIIDDPTEGGYGWFLIRSLSHRLIYQRAEAGNRLFIAISTANHPDLP